MPSDIKQFTAGRQLTGLRRVLDCVRSHRCCGDRTPLTCDAAGELRRILDPIRAV
ncbi:hypothetical protein [Streptomyces sp. NPDC058632]|uniref:hypothetical protein n=1 Tax=unclassified Streptomyces TaxID=2593676 RepID=UPI003659F6B2